MRIRSHLTANGTDELLAPTGLAATLDEPLAVVLGWNDNAEIEQGFEVEKKTIAPFALLAETPPDRNTHRDEAVLGNTTYTYRVSAFQGNLLSAPSNELIITLPLDTDGDGLSDNAEINRFLTNPFNADTDGLSNGTEFRLGTNPNKTDSDNNGTADSQEDADGDGMSNGWEQNNGTNPTQDDAGIDQEPDGLTNQEEAEMGTYPYNSYSDADSVKDGEDGWALDPDLHPPRIPTESYATINLTALGFINPVSGPEQKWNSL